MAVFKSYIFSGKTCPRPGKIPHGSWTCRTQNVPIYGTSFLDGEDQTYAGVKEVESVFIDRKLPQKPLKLFLASKTRNKFI